MRIVVPVLLSSAWVLSLAGAFIAPVRAQTPAPKALVQPAPRLAVTQEEPILTGPGRTHPEAKRPAAKKETKVEAPHAPPGKAAPQSSPSASAEPLPIPPRPPAVPPPASPEAQGTAAEKLPEPEKPEGVPSKLPRFASLRSDDVNMRVGPGQRYRIVWVYKRRELPVEITREFDVWRYVRDADGIQGWMQQATLMGRRTFIIHGGDATLREEAKDASPAVAVLKVGVIGRIRTCEASSDWCQVQAGSYRGFLRREQFWGTLPHEAIP